MSLEVPLQSHNGGQHQELQSTTSLNNDNETDYERKKLEAEIEYKNRIIYKMRKKEQTSAIEHYISTLKPNYKVLETISEFRKELEDCKLKLIHVIQ